MGSGERIEYTQILTLLRCRDVVPYRPLAQERTIQSNMNKEIMEIETIIGKYYK